MAVDLVGMDWGISLLQDTPQHKYERRMFESQLRSSLVHKHYAKMKRNCVLLLQNFLQDPEGFEGYLRQSVLFASQLLTFLSHQFDLI
jgi:hypothetical protein